MNTNHSSPLMVPRSRIQCTFLLLVFVLSQLIRTSIAINCNMIIDRNACSVASRDCAWSGSLDKCVDSLPCVLETSQQDCQENTWGCSWNAAETKCSSVHKAALPQQRCPQFTSKTDCSIDPTCVWRSGKCFRKPTIVYSIADDLGQYDVSWNNPRAITPVLTRLREQGVALGRHYTSPICGPSRAMILAGRMPWRVGLENKLNHQKASSLRCVIARSKTLLPELLKTTGGYETLGFGKWHMGHHSDQFVPTARGFDQFIGFYLGSVDRNSNPQMFWRRDLTCPGTKHRALCDVFDKPRPRRKIISAYGMMVVNETKGQPTRVFNSANIKEDGSDLFFATRAVEAIERVNVNQPLFLYVSWVAPHSPEWAPGRYLDTITNQSLGHDSPLQRACGLTSRLHHLGMVSVMDEGHRMIIDALDRTGRYEDSLLVFLSDNGAAGTMRSGPKAILNCGYGSNYPLRGGKYSWFEGGIRTVAFVHSSIHLPSLKRGTIDNSLVSATDWKVTILSASGVTIDPQERDLDFDHWPRLSSSNTSLTENNKYVRTEIPVQVWLDNGHYVIIFYHEGRLFKYMRGYPYTGTGAGTVGKQAKNYACSNIEQPFELPKAELRYSLSNGFGKSFLCHPECLFDIGDDIQENVNLALLNKKNKPVEVLQRGRSLMNEYAQLGVRFKQSGYCDPGYYATKTKFVVDPYGVRYAAACKAYLPWLYANMTYKPFTSCPGEVE